jgi:tetratricopeptide (TPR) repeat protein
LPKRSEHPQLPPETLIQRFITFVQAETWPESRSILKEHPELLNRETLEVLRSWVISIEDYEAAWWYQYHYALLQACQLMGVDSMFENFVPSTRPPDGIAAPPEFEDNLRHLAALDNAANSNPIVHHDRIELMEKILRRLDGRMYPSFRSAILINLGQAYAQLPKGDRAFNLAKAAAHFTEAAQFFTPKTAPPEYSESQNALGLSYMELTDGDPAANLEKAIASFNEALRFRSPDYAPLDYAKAKNNLGKAYSMLPAGDHVANLRRAIACFTDALRALTSEDAATDHALVQENLALTTAELNRISRETR